MGCESSCRWAPLFLTTHNSQLKTHNYGIYPLIVLAVIPGLPTATVTAR